VRFHEADQRRREVQAPGADRRPLERTRQLAATLGKFVSAVLTHKNFSSRRESSGSVASLKPKRCRLLTHPDLVVGPGLLIGARRRPGDATWEEPMLKFEDSNKGSRLLLSEDEQDLGEILRLELDRLVSLLHQLMRLPKNVWAQIQATRARSSVDK
jgi:hypothetical protein